MIKAMLFTHCWLLSLVCCVGCSAAWVYNKMHTLCTLYERHICLMCRRINAAQHCLQIHQEFYRKINHFLIVVSFLHFYKHIAILFSSIIQKCNLNVTIGKQPTGTLWGGIYTPVASEERSKSIWRSNNTLMNSRQL